MTAFDWMDSALCAQVGPDAFFTDLSSNDNSRTALKICNACPVQAECLAFAQDTEGASGIKYRHGTWGGQTRTKRVKTRQDAAVVARDVRILDLSGQGLPAAEVAERVGCTARTVERVRANHRQQREAA